MVKKLIYVCMIFFTIFISHALSDDSSTKNISNNYSLEILQPARDSMDVGYEMDVLGTASIPSGNYVWVLVHQVEGFEDVWWPQNEGKVDLKTKKWKAHVVFGGKQDISYDFEIAAIVVNKKEHDKLKEYRSQALKTEKWSPIDMPPTEMAPVIRKVTKVNNN